MNKYLIYYTILIISTNILSGCNDNLSMGREYTPSLKAQYLSLYPTTITFSSAAQSRNLLITSYASWVVLGKPDWLTVSSENGEGNADLTLSAPDYWSTNARYGTLKIGQTGTEKTALVSLKQVGRTFEDLVETLTFSRSASSQSVTIKTDGQWNTKCSSNWLTVTPSSGTGTTEVTISVMENTKEDDRIGTVTVNVGELSKSISVTQMGTSLEFTMTNKENTVAIEKIAYPCIASSKSVTIKTEGQWNAICSSNWLTVTPSSGTGTTEVTISVLENTKEDDRIGTITVSVGELSRALSITQIGRTKEQEFTVTGYGNTAVTFKMKLVRAGTFMMGESADGKNVTPVHAVTLTKDYYIGETEVTQALWYAVMGQKPTSDGNAWSRTYGLGDDYPAYYISYNDCQQFLTKLNQITGKSFRFPTEAEWEFAAKGDNCSMGYNYSGSNTIGDVAWYDGNSKSMGSASPDYGTHAVKTKAPNELGIYDMSGNVWERCLDWYDDYPSAAQTDPAVTTKGSSISHVIRGGSWATLAGSCRCANRSGSGSTARLNIDGFRLALTAD